MSSDVGSVTLGMRLDACLESLDSMSSTQLYSVIVLAVLALCFVLLGTGGSSTLDGMASSLPVEEQSKTRNPTGYQEPRWHIFKWVNAAAILAFGGSLVYVSFWLEDTNDVEWFGIGWSLFLCYCLGFFGVSFVYKNLDAPPSSVESVAPSAASSPSKAVAAPVKKVPCAAAPTETSKASLPSNLLELEDDAIAQLVVDQTLKDHELEKRLDPHRAVAVRRLAMAQKLQAISPEKDLFENLPHQPSLDYSQVYGANCEIVVGYVPLPVGLVGPLRLNDKEVYIPMATTEGCLVASTNRGCKAITQGGGAVSVVVKDGITRAPCLRMASAAEAARVQLWCQSNFDTLKQAFESTTRFGKLNSCHPTIAGRNLYLRLVCNSGDAMGMNMVSKGSLAVIDVLKREFPSLELVALSGNMCTDKKAAATNWIHGRGKSVVVEATIPKEVVRKTLKTTVSRMVETNLHKNLIGSAMACSVGGFNAHAANIVTAVFLATGQDPAQNVESSNCITLLEETADGDLWISCTMPSLEVGTVGGGTTLKAQAACLDILQCRGGCTEHPGQNAQQLAQIVAGATMAGELSLLAALAANTLVQAHMAHNRKK